MNDRERFLQIARFERPGDPYDFHQWIWLEAIERWQREGLPKEAHPLRVLSLGQDFTEFLPIHNLLRNGRPYFNPPYFVSIVPWFERTVVQDEKDTQVVRDEDGILYRISKITPGVLPQYLEYPVRDRASWNEYRKLLDPHTPARWPRGWDRIDLGKTMYAHDPKLQGRPWNERDFPLGMNSLSLMGLPRNFMGLENFSYALYEDRPLIEEIADHMLWMNLEIARTVFNTGIQIDFCYLWEDICYKSGPLFSPRMMREIMVPRWKTFSGFLRDHGVAVILVDCDGNLDEFLPLVVEGGLNGILPFEVAARNDILAARKRYGKNLILFGGIDKRAIAEGRGAIDAELQRVAKPLLAQSGYFPMLDHYAPPDISFENFLYYKMRLKGLRSAE
ncbi:MAG: uroporphyrinogen decarboxylase family protein [Spirochaetia bacterium]|jgi:uroporphyrinogen decarboxylase